MQQVVRKLHKIKKAALFIKLDISKAFNSVNWPYLLEIMSFLGFGQRCRDWISILWSTTSSCFLLNGEPGKRIIHARRVRQGDPLPPIIFLLAMEPLHKLFQQAQEFGIICKLDKSCNNFRMSLYVDDADVFIQPTTEDYMTAKMLLRIFGAASRLQTNMEKTEVYPIRCEGYDLTQIIGPEQRICQFLCKYLGLPLHYRKLP